MSIPYQHVVRPSEAETGHPQISPITKIPPMSNDGIVPRAPENLRHLRNLRISRPVFFPAATGVGAYARDILDSDFCLLDPQRPMKTRIPQLDRERTF